MAESIRVLVLGDVVGASGMRAVFSALGGIVTAHKADLVVVNGENAAAGRGMMPEDVQRLFDTGVHVITSGNHIWQRKEILPLLDAEEHLLRPENYPPGVPGKGHCVVNIKGHDVGVLNLQGRVRMSPLRCPFRAGRESLTRLKQNARVLIVDFHAEATEEKEALAHYLDGKCSLIFGTHTHVQTADERILPSGTAYITDIGMTGPAESVIGMSVETGIKRAQTQMPLRLEVENGPARICGIVVDIDAGSGRALAIERIREMSVV